MLNLYAVKAYHHGAINDHSYIVGFTETVEAAHALADAEHQRVQGVYAMAVLRVITDESGALRGTELVRWLPSEQDDGPKWAHGPIFAELIGIVATGGGQDKIADWVPENVRHLAVTLAHARTKKQLEPNL